MWATAYQSTKQQSRTSPLVPNSTDRPSSSSSSSSSSATRAQKIAEFEQDMAAAKARREGGGRSSSSSSPPLAVETGEKEKARDEKEKEEKEKISFGNKLAEAVSGGQWEHGNRTAGDSLRDLRGRIEGRFGRK